MKSADTPPWPWYDQDEIDAVTRVLRSGKVIYWTGTEGREFEREFLNRAQHSRAVELPPLRREDASPVVDWDATLGGSARNDHRPVNRRRRGGNLEDPGRGSAHERVEVVPRGQEIPTEDRSSIPMQPTIDPNDRP